MKQILIIIMFIFLGIPVYATDYPLNMHIEPMIKNKEHNYKEADYVNAYCNGQIEYVLNDKTRIDCLTEYYAIEFDWAKKWAESIGQAMYYAKMTDKLPAVAIIMKSPQELKYIKRIRTANNNITIFKIKAY